MRIETTRFGSLEIDESAAIRFPWGLPGFEHLRRFALLSHRPGPFRWLQSLEDPATAFVVCEPEAAGLLYRVPPERGAPVGIERGEDLAILVMVSFDRKKKAARPNVRGPILLNAKTRDAWQWSLDAGDLKRFVEPLPPIPSEAASPSA